MISCISQSTSLFTSTKWEGTHNQIMINSQWVNTSSNSWGPSKTPFQTPADVIWCPASVRPLQVHSFLEPCDLEDLWAVEVVKQQNNGAYSWLYQYKESFHDLRFYVNQLTWCPMGT